MMTGNEPIQEDTSPDRSDSDGTDSADGPGAVDASDGSSTVDAAAEASEAGGPATNGADPADASKSAPASTELVGENLEIGYPSTDEPVVECESVVLPAGEVTALVGPNGSGKSTLLKAMANQLTPENGHVLLDGERVRSIDAKSLAKQLGLLSQENESPGSLTVESLVTHGRYPHRGFFDSLSEADYEAVDRAMRMAGVDHLRDADVSSLSGGQKQLVWIAMVLAQETDVLLLDEPTTYLDLHHQLRVMEVVRTLNREQGVTVGVVLHDIGQAARFADNLIAMKDGEAYDWGPPKEVVTEELLADVFSVDATVDAESETGPHISPHSALEE